MRSFREELEELRSADLHRQLRMVSGSEGRYVVMDGRRCTLFCSNNYLGLADHPLLKQAAVRAVEQAGTGSGASRLVSGNMELHEILERRIASFKGTEAALLFNSGYAANTGVIPALIGRDGVIFSDRLNHASIVDGAVLSRARLIRYPHNDMKALRRLLSSTEAAGRRLIVSDGIFSMDGDIAPLEELVALKKEFKALLMVDDAHGTGALGATGRGSAELTGTMAAIDIHMGTLGKALGSFGAYVAASQEIIEYLINTARSFIFSTSLPPAVVAASLAALEVVDSPEGAVLREKLCQNADHLREALCSAGFDTMGSVTQIVPVAIGDATDVMAYSKALLQKGIFVQGIRPPTVPAGSCRLRFTVMATHTSDDIAEAVAAITAVRQEQRIRSSAVS